MHVGAFTPDGTWRAAGEHLDDLVRLGVNAIEVMPIAAFAGSRGWGYDGVALYAPFAPYGEPDDLRAFVSACHARGLAVVLDVVYNHFGPAGNYLGAYAPEYFTAEHQTPWGNAPDFTEPHLRRLVLDNARYWLEEFDFDGLRLDATHAIIDDSPLHVLAELASIAASLSPKRVLIAEDERNDPRLVTSHHLDAIWADDFHHVLHAITTSERDGYYGAYTADVTELARTIERGWRYEGEIYEPWRAPRGRSAVELDAGNLVYCVQNHDQIGNRAFGTRLHHEAGVDAHASAAMLLLFLPMVPLLFMGEEWAASAPFLYFTDFDAELGRAVTSGRREEFARFRAFADPELRAKIPDPQAPSTFESSRLKWEERTRAPHARVLALYQRMLALRSSDPVLSAPSRATMACETHGSLLVVRRWLGADDRVLLFNPGRATAPIPLEMANVAEHDILARSVERFHPGEVPGHGAVLLSRLSR
jgi:maltooligosyltrehalose trehalohydrolase